VPETQDPRYPVGKFTPSASINLADRSHAIEVLAETPGLLREALRGLDTDQKNTPYREDGWTVRQVVHHVADSHMTAFHRVRRALTEENPLIPGYDEKAFSVLPDVVAPTEWSMEIIEALHARWVMLLQGLDEAQWKRTMNHAERGVSTIEATTLLYAWHSRHHLAHITHLRAKQGW
jgi:hypothetical protein